MSVIVFGLIWIAFSVLAYSRWWAHFSTEYAYLGYGGRDEAVGIVFALIGGPISFLVSLAFGRHGFRWR